MVAVPLLIRSFPHAFVGPGAFALGSRDQQVVAVNGQRDRDTSRWG